jgi:hypothetical protein
VIPELDAFFAALELHDLTHRSKEAAMPAA